jgi:hypothetical protein
MKADESLRPWISAGQRALRFRPSPEEFGARIEFLWRLFGKRLAEMPPWMADEFNKILAGAASGPMAYFKMLCGMRRLVLTLHRAAREAERERM